MRNAGLKCDYLRNGYFIYFDMNPLSEMVDEAIAYIWGKNSTDMRKYVIETNYCKIIKFVWVNFRGLSMFFER